MRAARANRHQHGGIDAFMHEYGLTSEEGIILMCLAEALLRIPDKDTADALIAEKIGGGRWERHLGHSDSLFVNASTFGLMLTGRVVRLGEAKGTSPAAVLKRLVARSGEPFIRQALRQAMRILGDNFVLGRTIEEALRARRAAARRRATASPTTCWASAAETAKDAERYFERYMSADRGDRPGQPPARGTPTTQALLARPEHLGQALGHPSALRSRQGGASRRASCCRASSSWPRPPAGAASASPSMRRSRTGSI